MRFFKKKSAVKSRPKVSPEASCIAFCFAPVADGRTGLGVVRYEGQIPAEFSKKNGEFLRHRGLNGIENIRVSLQSCGVSRGLEIRKVALRI